MTGVITGVGILFLLAGLAAYVFDATWVAEQSSQMGIILVAIATFATKAR
ncbi:MAG: hypothetical protein NVS2B3_11990 [Vulcanimicrobiaceae bacterium]